MNYAAPIAIAAVLIVSAYVLAGMAFSRFEQDIMSAVTQRNEAYIDEFTRHAADVLDERFQGATEATEALTSDPRVREIVDGQDFASRLSSLEKESQFDHVRYIDAQGMTHTSSGDIQDVSFRDYYIEGMKGDSGVTYMLESVVNGNRQIGFYAPVTVDSRVVGVIATFYDEGTLADSITTYFYGEQASAGIITRNGEMLVNANSEFMRGLYDEGLPENACDLIETSYVTESDAESVRNAYTNLEESSFDFNWQGTPNTGYIAPLKTVGLSLYMIFPYQATQDAYQNSVEIGSTLRWSLYIILAIVFWVIVGICVLVVVQVRRSSNVAAERDAARQASEAKTNFLFNMSHDIRTPMNAIIGYTGLMRKHQDDPERCSDYLDKIEKSSGALLSIINNVLEMSRIENGALQLEEHLLPTGEVTAKLAEIYSPLMEAKGITFTFTADVKSAGVYIDDVKTLEIMENVMSNAYKYTEPGGHIAVSLVEIPDAIKGRSHFRTTVSDDGAGMSEEYLSHIYERFSRERTSTESKTQGTGLGMSIVKRLVDLMDGEIEIESELGVGTTVTVTIPHRVSLRTHEEGGASEAMSAAGDAAAQSIFEGEAAQGAPVDTVATSEGSTAGQAAGASVAQSQEAPNDATLDFEGKRLLLVEDNELNAEIAIEILSEVGFEMERAVDGVEGVEKVEQAEPGYYDAVLMDIQMPRMNGYEATRAIRALDDVARSQVPIVAMTANAFAEDRQNALNAGMNGFVAKPIDIPELMNVLARVLG